MKNERYAFILVSDEKNWYKMCEHCRGQKGIIAFVRKSMVAPVETQKLLFYVKKPVMQIRGVADFFERQTGEREELWRRLGKESCFQSFDEYLDFIEGREKATFVRFKNFRELENPVSVEVFTSVTGLSSVFRGGRYLTLEQLSRLLI
jgi:predicted transcriptional regulator